MAGGDAWACTGDPCEAACAAAKVAGRSTEGKAGLVGDSAITARDGAAGSLAGSATRSGSSEGTVGGTTAVGTAGRESAAGAAAVDASVEAAVRVLAGPTELTSGTRNRTGGWSAPPDSGDGVAAGSARRRGRTVAGLPPVVVD